MKVPPRLSIYGAGKVGKVLARLWFSQGLVRIGEVFTRSRSSAQDAAIFIGSGAGKVIGEPPVQADIWLITCPDQHIATAAQQLSLAQVLRPQTIILHCSGNSSSALLDITGAQCASVHPVHSFAKPEKSLLEFSGSYCTAEGSPTALSRLKILFEAIGGQWLNIDTAQKSLYHAATVIASNHLVTLIDQALRLAQTAGLSHQQSRALLAPLAHQSLQNVLTLPAQEALTGPVSRGDSITVSAHLNALGQISGDSRDKALYYALACATLDIAKQQGPLEQFAELEKILI